jgi:cbb3-type cytochrome oxidase subunit 3
MKKTNGKIMKLLILSLVIGIMFSAILLRVDSESFNVGELETVPTQNTQLTSIEGNEIPLFAPMGIEAWALMNMIICVLGTVITVVALAYATRRKMHVDIEKEGICRYEDDDTYVSRNRLHWLAATAVMGIAGIFLFLLTQDMSNPVVLVDIWTIIHAVIFAAEFIAALFVFKRGKASKPGSEQVSPFAK